MPLNDLNDNRGYRRHLAGLVASTLILLVSPGCEELVEQEAAEQLEQAETALEREEWEEANDQFYEATQIDPSNPDAWAGRGMALTQLSEKEAAREHYLEALHLIDERLVEEPGDRAAFQKRMLILVLLGDAERAREIAAAAAEESPRDRFYQEMPAMIDSWEKQFAAMILSGEETE